MTKASSSDSRRCSGSGRAGRSSSGTLDETVETDGQVDVIHASRLNMHTIMCGEHRLLPSTPREGLGTSTPHPPARPRHLCPRHLQSLPLRHVLKQECGQSQVIPVLWGRRWRQSSDSPIFTTLQSISFVQSICRIHPPGLDLIPLVAVPTSWQLAQRRWWLKTQPTER